MFRSLSQRAFDALTSEDTGQVDKDISENSYNDQPKNFTIHIMSLSLTKTADGLIDPKLILSWILSSLGAPVYFIGMLVPVREAGALLPQLFIAGFLKSRPKRKYAWVLGSVIQGVCAVGLGLSVLMLEGFSLGVAIIGLLALLAAARSICSVSYKDVLGKTVDRSNRGTATGAASSMAAAFVILYALLVTSGIFDKQSLITLGLFLAGICWISSSLLFSTLTEEESDIESKSSPIDIARENLEYLLQDRQLILFILTRGLLMATALAPPFMIALAINSVTDYAGLGLMLLASSLAGLSSGYIWGRLADRSSRKVLMLSGLFAGCALLATVIFALTGLLETAWIMPVTLYALMISYQGVRLGRSTHLVDMADENRRAPYTALSNTIIGTLLLAGGGFSFVAAAFGEIAVLGIFSGMCFLSMISAYFLMEAQS
ncbi:MFS transporter [Sneathiella aquimaris]|uniref:MFS transporter n=1 Tax=Sneathiella aquimaris TaxID=2599305 RepID=UPI00146E8746|nr:MFS transporter [Sneathiella aquimaris]